MELWGEDPTTPAIKHSRVQELNPTNEQILLSNKSQTKTTNRKSFRLDLLPMVLSQLPLLQGREHPGPGFGWTRNLLCSIQVLFILSIPQCNSGNDTREFKDWIAPDPGCTSTSGFPRNWWYLELSVSKTLHFPKYSLWGRAGLPVSQLEQLSQF